MKSRLLDLAFLIGVVVKGLNGLVELIGGIVLIFVSPAQLAHVATIATASELSEDPDDILANLILHGVGRLDAATARFIAYYLILHGVVKVVIVTALVRGTRRIYPWAIAALTAFLVYQIYQLVVGPSVGVVVLTVLDAIIIALTWREWHEGRTLKETWRSTLRWVFRRPEPAG